MSKEDTSMELNFPALCILLLFTVVHSLFYVWFPSQQVIMTAVRISVVCLCDMGSKHASKPDKQHHSVVSKSSCS